MKRIKIKPFVQAIEFSWTKEDRSIFVLLMHEFISFTLSKQKAGERIKVVFDVSKTCINYRKK